MEERKMTAVEWLIEQIYRNPIAIYKDEIFNQAKQMEKEQIEDAFDAGWDSGQKGCEPPKYEYYDKTYKNK
jgi:hypothetical protein